MHDHDFQLEENMKPRSLFDWYNSIVRAGLNMFPPLSFPPLLLIFLFTEKLINHHILPMKNQHFSAEAII